MSTIYERIHDLWLSEGMVVNDDVSPSAIDELEAKHRIRLPDEFRNYLMVLGGFASGQGDENLISFLSLDEIDQELNKTHNRSCPFDIMFAHYLVYSHYYVLRIGTNAEQYGVFAKDNDNEKLIAPSFEVFLNAYLTHPKDIAYCW